MNQTLIYFFMMLNDANASLLYNLIFYGIESYYLGLIDGSYTNATFSGHYCFCFVFLIICT